ncbi:MAG: SRPBCC family protein [Actinomycetota bacterium]
MLSHVTEPASSPASIEVVVEAVIRRPPEVVAAYASDPSNAPGWYANISEVTWKTAPPLRVGSEVAFVARFLGRELRYLYEVVEHTPSSLVMRTAEGPFPMETSYQYAATPEGHTRMTLRNRGTPEGFSRFLSPFLRLAMRRANRKDLGALRERLEQ